jgi:hypothetical protein
METLKHPLNKALQRRLFPGMHDARLDRAQGWSG